MVRGIRVGHVKTEDGKREDDEYGRCRTRACRKDAERTDHENLPPDGRVGWAIQVRRCAAVVSPKKRKRVLREGRRRAPPGGYCVDRAYAGAETGDPEASVGGPENRCTRCYHGRQQEPGAEGALVSVVGMVGREDVHAGPQEGSQEDGYAGRRQDPAEGV